MGRDGIGFWVGMGPVMGMRSGIEWAWDRFWMGMGSGLRRRIFGK